MTKINIENKRYKIVGNEIIIFENDQEYIEYLEEKCETLVMIDMNKIFIPTEPVDYREPYEQPWVCPKPNRPIKRMVQEPSDKRMAEDSLWYTYPEEFFEVRF